jgi:hypothetical protein
LDVAVTKKPLNQPTNPPPLQSRPLQLEQVVRMTPRRAINSRLRKHPATADKSWALVVDRQPEMAVRSWGQVVDHQQATDVR